MIAQLTKKNVKTVIYSKVESLIPLITSQPLQNFKKKEKKRDACSCGYTSTDTEDPRKEKIEN